MTDFIRTHRYSIVSPRWYGLQWNKMWCWVSNIFIPIYFRKDELDGLGQTVLVLQSQKKLPSGQYSACGAEQHNGVSALSHKHLHHHLYLGEPDIWAYPEINPRFFIVIPPSQSNGHSSSHSAAPDHAHFLCPDLDSAARLAAQPPPRWPDRDHLGCWWDAGLQGKPVLSISLKRALLDLPVGGKWAVGPISHTFNQSSSISSSIQLQTGLLSQDNETLYFHGVYEITLSAQTINSMKANDRATTCN